MERSITVKKICDALGLDYLGKNIELNGLFLYGRSTMYQSVLSYATSQAWTEKLLSVQEVKAAVIRGEYLQELTADRIQKCTWIISSNPEKTFYDIHDYLIDHTDFYETFDFPSQIGKNCRIHPTAEIERGVKIGDNVTVEAYAVIRAGTTVGNNVVISSFTVIGEEGFQVLRVDGKTRKIRHCGQTVIEDNVEIGAQNVIHRSLFEGATTIGENAKLDTNIYIAHNCFVGENAVITSGCVMCGSSTMQSGSWLGPNSSVLNKVVVGAESMIGMGSVVTRNISQGTLAYGVPAKEK